MRLALLVLLAACTPYPAAQYGAQPGTPAGDACARMCGKYLDCKGANQPAAFQECTGTCNPDTVDPARVAELEAMECPAFVAMVEGGGAAPGETPASPSGDLAGVWVAEEASLTPGIYMSYTQYLTLYPDGSVTYAKSEGGASRTQISEQTERFRSWRTGTQPAGRVVGRWESNGAQVVVQFSIWNQLRSQGRVLGPAEMTLSGMGALEEGATLTFRRQ